MRWSKLVPNGFGGRKQDGVRWSDRTKGALSAKEVFLIRAG